MSASPFSHLSLNVPDTSKPRIVVLGGGFGGIRLAQGIDSRHYQVVMLDRNNYHGFQPLLYQVATAGLEPDSIAGPLRRLFVGRRDFHFRMARVTGIQPSEKIVDTVIGGLHYDHLVVATGSRPTASPVRNTAPTESVEGADRCLSKIMSGHTPGQQQKHPFRQ